MVAGKVSLHADLPWELRTIWWLQVSPSHCDSPKCPCTLSHQWPRQGLEKGWGAGLPNFVASLSFQVGKNSWDLWLQLFLFHRWTVGICDPLRFSLRMDTSNPTTGEEVMYGNMGMMQGDQCISLCFCVWGVHTHTYGLPLLRAGLEFCRTGAARASQLCGPVWSWPGGHSRGYGAAACQHLWCQLCLLLCLPFYLTL